MIRPMETDEIVKALRRAAVVCIENGRCDWWNTSVCVADATAWAAIAMLEDDDGVERDPAHAAHFLLLVAEATA